MKDATGNLPVACSLSDAEFRVREDALLTQFRSAVIVTEELADGYAFRIPGDKARIAMVAELIAVERECCPFLTLELVAQPNLGPVILRITGPCGTKEFLKGTFCR